MADRPLNIFQVAGHAMSAQLVRLNTTASNLANAGVVSGSAETAYRTKKPVFRTEFDNVTGLSSVNVESIVTAGSPPTKTYDPTNALADKDGNVYEAAVDETRELVDMLETSRNFQNNVEVLQTAKSLILDTLKLGQ